QVAQRAGVPLVIAGIVQDKGYFEEMVSPYIDGDQIRYIGPIGMPEKGELLGHARALLHMINFDEPFGLSVVESMACGTPVIAIDRGSMPELIRDGETGFLAASSENAVESMRRIDGIDRRKCRTWVEKHFTEAQMVEKYIQVYKMILEEE
ncbi:MAG: glycosyltransferase, partial [Candidatus Bipolaricaulota bacterium]|nr:glycosyltransferase [Candidatus Bipolaricaulota bacterium]